MQGRLKGMREECQKEGIQGDPEDIGSTLDAQCFPLLRSKCAGTDTGMGVGEWNDDVMMRYKARDLHMSS